MNVTEIGQFPEGINTTQFITDIMLEPSLLQRYIHKNQNALTTSHIISPTIHFEAMNVTEIGQFPDGINTPPNLLQTSCLLHLLQRWIF